MIPRAQLLKELLLLLSYYPLSDYKEATDFKLLYFIALYRF